ncbi:RNA-binding domain-containing protein [Aquisphaera insulae]|uniref:RNA-binding domain-containing protein n=1 Tax=Aquisphaera insulae TaxID=2712864 RepID=UPI0013EC06D5|nr:RNA-binding domain-containing protein [Aquisphaera insulae]
MPTSGGPSLARGFYEQFLGTSDKPGFVRGLVNSTPLTFEKEWLEFKVCPVDTANPQKAEQKLKTLWATNLAAFANTEGGVLIWGIKAKEVDKIDAACGVEMVPRPEELRSRLMQLHHLATNPPLSGVEVHAVTDEGEKGFVVCYIPQGRFVPYRAEFDINQYYIRVGDDSVVPSPVILRRLFFPQSLARIEVLVDLYFEKPPEADQSVRRYHYDVTMRNIGNTTAHDVYIVIEDDLYDLRASNGLTALTGWRPVTVTGNRSSFTSMVPIHPGLSAPVATSQKWYGMPSEGLDIKVWVYWRDAEHQTLATTFASGEVMRSARIYDKIQHICTAMDLELQ